MQICTALIRLVYISHLSWVIIMFSLKMYKYCVLIETKGNIFKMKKKTASNSGMLMKKL